MSTTHLFWTCFSDELFKTAAKSPITLKVPQIGTNLKGMERYTANPGKTPITSPGKESGTLASTSGVGHSFPIGRTGTSANPAPTPQLVR
jgi:hypothetical protein